jgi:hypothetical protein
LTGKHERDASVAVHIEKLIQRIEGVDEVKTPVNPSTPQKLRLKGGAEVRISVRSGPIDAEASTDMQLKVEGVARG